MSLAQLNDNGNLRWDECGARRLWKVSGCRKSVGPKACGRKGSVEQSPWFRSVYSRAESYLKTKSRVLLYRPMHLLCTYSSICIIIPRR